MDINFFDISYLNGDTIQLPFRVGDIVEVTDWGYFYPAYKNAVRYFTNSKKDETYYSINYKERKKVKEFKIFGLAHHVNGYEIVAYIKDRFGGDALVDVDGLRLIKQFPLRIGESTILKIETLKR